MPFHDLHVQYTSPAALKNTLTFLSELEYSIIAISLSVTGKLPTPASPVALESLSAPKNVSLLSRLTLTVSDPSQNHRLSSLQSTYDLIALRPTTDKALALCCSSLDCDLISLDLSQRLPFILKFKTVASALQRGIRFEICYSAGITGGSDARRNLISGATSLIRATRGRGIVISSEAKSALSARGPWDVINLAQIWGLTQERAKEALCEEARKVVKLAKLKRESFRGVVHVIDGGQRLLDTGAEKAEAYGESPAKEITLLNGVKRKASSTSIGPSQTQANEEKPLSKREMKRRAKKAKMEGKEESGVAEEDDPDKKSNGLPIQHETFVQKQAKKN